MNKVKAVIDRFEGVRAVLRVGGEDIVMPKKLLSGFNEGDTVSILISSESEDTKDSAKVAKALVADLFKEE